MARPGAERSAGRRRRPTMRYSGRSGRKRWTFAADLNAGRDQSEDEVTATLSAMALLALLVSPVNGPEGRRAAILQLEDQWRVAQHKNDRAALGSLFAEDLTFIGTSGSLPGRAPLLPGPSSSP